MIAFLFSALTAIVVFKVTSAPFRFMSLLVGLLSLIALFVGLLGEDSPVAKLIGLGGVERWVVFPIIVWLALFGGHILGSTQRMQPERRGRAAMNGRAGARVDPPVVVPPP